MGQIESRFHGAPEIRIRQFVQNRANPLENPDVFKGTIHPKKRKDIDGRWFDCPDIAMHLWDWYGTGTRVGIGYYEFDPGISWETLESLGEVVVDLLTLTQIDSLTVPNQLAIYGNIRRSVATGIRNLRMRSINNDFIGTEDYEIRNPADYWEYGPGETKIRTWPDL